MTKHTKEFLISILYLFIWLGIVTFILGIGSAITGDRDFSWFYWIIDWLFIGVCAGWLHKITESHSK